MQKSVERVDAIRPDGAVISVPKHLVGTTAWKIQRMKLAGQNTPKKIAPLVLSESDVEEVTETPAEKPKRGRPAKNQQA